MIASRGNRHKVALTSPLQSTRLPPTQSSTRCESHPLVSIILCTLGTRTASLDRCLVSLTTQECTKREILVVLNARMTDTFRAHMASYPITLLEEPRRGVCAARNRAIPATRGRIVAFVDDDIVAESNWLHELLIGFEDPKIACVTGRVVPEGPITLPRDKTERIYFSERALSSWTLDPSDPDCYAKALGDPAGFGCNMAIRKDFLEAYSMFPEDLGAGTLIGGDEFYMFVQVLKHGFRVRHNAAAIVTHYFEEADGQKPRVRRIYVGASAFATKLLVEEKDIRMGLLRWGLAALSRRFDRIRARKRLTAEAQELLSSKGKIAAYLEGLWVYWQSRSGTGPKEQ